ncbi:hypothetical protein Tco_1153648 [Tanacetum coccineum]
MMMEHRDDAGVVVFTSRLRGCLVLGDYWFGSSFWSSLARFDLERYCLTWMLLILFSFSYVELGDRGISTDGDFLIPPPSYTLIRDLMLRLYHRMMAHSIARRSQAPEKDSLVIDEGGQADPALVQAQPPLPPPAAARTMPQRMARLEEDVCEIRGALTEQREVIDAMSHDFSRLCTRTTTILARMMDKACVTYTSYSQTPREYTRHVRRRTDGASTSTAQQDPQQPDL